MIIELIGWRSTGLRCPDATIDLTHAGRPSHVALLQMPNGTGKTTTLHMLLAAMNGEATRWDAERVRTYRRADADVAEGRFVLDLRIDDRPLTFELTLDFEIGQASYKTSAPGSGGVTHGWSPPPAVQRFLNEEFTKLFIFDGEFAERLLDARETEAAHAIDALFQLYLLEEVERAAEDDWQLATRRKAPSLEGSQRRLGRRIDDLKEQIRRVRLAAEKATKERDAVAAEAARLQETLDEYLGGTNELKEQFECLNAREQAARAEVERAADAAMGLIRQPASLHPAFGLALRALDANLERLKLPSSTSAQFFLELLEGEACICGRPLDESARAALQGRAASFLGEDAVGFLNALKQDVDLYLEQAGSATPETLTAALGRLEQAVRSRDLAATELRVIKQKLIDQGDEEIDQLEKALATKLKRQEELDEFLHVVTREPLPADTDVTDTLCLQSLQRQLTKVERELSKVAGTVTLRRKTDVLVALVHEALLKARASIGKALVDECNARLEEVLAHDPVRIAGIGTSLVLRGQAAASVGQTLSIGYVFLATLLARGQHQVPLVVDSPANPLDNSVRRQIGGLVPKLCKQFVALTTSSEREAFTDFLDEGANGDVKYLTHFRLGPGTRYLLQWVPEDAVFTSNGVVVEGKAFFDRFDVRRRGAPGPVMQEP